MKQLLLVDANSMVFRAYYATAYTRMMRTSSGQPTNALHSFVNMVLKALEVIEPDAILFAFDAKAKTFRHEQYEAYKATRTELPQELIDQFQLVRDYLDAFNMKRYEIEGYEADDIIGTMVKRYQDVKKIILTSDRDMLQLIDANTQVMLMKRGLSETELMDEALLHAQQGLTPAQIVDLKSLMGDSSDNIPGVTGIGEKTAKRLLDDFKTLDGVYENLDQLKGKLLENLQTQKDQAYLSYDLATIFKDVPLDVSDAELMYEPDWQNLAKFLRTYEMEALVEMISKFNHEPSEDRVEWVAFDPKLYQGPTFVMASNAKELDVTKTCDAFLVANDKYLSQIDYQDVSDAFKVWAASAVVKYAYDSKMLFHLCASHSFELNNVVDDVWIMAFLDDTSLTTLDKFKDKWHIAINKKEIIVSDGMFAQKVVKQYDHLKQALIAKNMLELYETIEFPLIDVLYRMESHGISVDEDNLARLNEETLAKVTALEKEIFELTQHEFNVNSPKQLAEVLYDELGLPQIKKRSTAIDVLEALLNRHPVIEKIIEYRKFQKFYSTYTAGLQKHIGPDQKIHTVYNQCATQTGRLSSNHPNMQNISVKNEETAIIRKIFVAEADSVLLSADYSQIELRLLAHMAQEQAMLDAFNHHLDIHAKTAMDIFGVAFEDVTDAMRRQAKAVNFGIIYGMSDYGLAQQINVTRKEASQFMKSYHQSFPKIAKFMEDTIAFAQANGYVQTIFKRRRAIDELYSSVYSVREFGKRAAMNAPIQGSAADLMKIAMLKVDAKLREKQAKSTLLLQVHDEIVLNVTHDELDWVKTMVEAAMVEVVTLDVPLEVSISVGQNWYEAK